MANYNNRAPRAPKINSVELLGTVQPRGRDQEIKFFQFNNGGGAIHISVLVTEDRGADEQGQPKQVNTYIPVSVYANKLISAEQLKSIRPGTKVRVVGRLASKTYDNKRTGQKSTSIEVDAFVFEVLEQPQQAASYGYAQAPQYPGAPQGGFMPQQAPQYPGAPQGGYMSQQAPQYPGAQQYPGAPQGGYMPQQAPQYPGAQQYPGAPQGGFMPQPQYAPQQAPAQPQMQAQAPAQQAQAPAQAAPQFRQPIYSPQPAQQTPPPYYQPPVDDDLPPDTPANGDIAI